MEINVAIGGMTKDLNQIAMELNSKGTPYAFITVISVKGSAPRHIGSKMIVTQNETFETIGGGALEHQAIKDARERLKTGRAEVLSYPLGPLLGQCCGGDVELFIEPVTLSKNIVVFGAGHVAEELVPLLKKLHFSITLVDERQERINLTSFSMVDNRINELPSDTLKSIKFSENLYIIVITHAHKDDEGIVEYCLDKPFKYLGLIGSRHKWDKFKTRYKAKGVTEEQLKRITTPIGLDIGSETPFEIAISIVGELIKINSTPKGFESYKQGVVSS